MKVLVAEDSDDKFAAIHAELLRRGVTIPSIKRVGSIVEMNSSLQSNEHDLCILDLWLPYMKGGPVMDTTRDVLQIISETKRTDIPFIIISSHIEDARGFVGSFAAQGCPIYSYDDYDVWSKALEIYIALARDRHRYDFVILTALEEERHVYMQLADKVESVIRKGMDFWDFQWGGRNGAVVCLPRMGLVNATSITSRLLEHYSPTVICMSGICGGIGDDVHIGQLLIMELCWEYQSGKWSDDYFSAEPYQVDISEDLRLHFSKAVQDTELVERLEKGFDGSNRPSMRHNPKLGIFATGSAVIASDRRLENLKSQHRKVTGIDMEIYGFHRAVNLSMQTHIKHFSAKVVVDKAGHDKDDKVHAYGSYVSAKFCLETIKALLA